MPAERNSPTSTSATRGLRMVSSMDSLTVASTDDGTGLEAASLNEAASEKNCLTRRRPLESIVIVDPAGTDLISLHAVRGSGMLPSTNSPARAASLVVVEIA